MQRISFLVMLTSLSAQRLESLSNLVRDCTLKVATIEEVNIRVRGVQAPVCKPLLSVGRIHDDGWEVTVLYGGQRLHVPHSNVAKKIDAWIQKEMRDSQYIPCTVAYKENNMYNIYLKPKGNKTVCATVRGLRQSSLGGLPAGSEPVRPEDTDPEDPGRVRTRKTG